MRIYVLECDGAPYAKIGVAKNPDARVKSVQNGCPYRLSVAFATPTLKREIAYQVEKKTHTILKAYHKLGEWFEINSEDAIWAISEARRKVKNKRAETSYRVHCTYEECDRF